MLTLTSKTLASVKSFRSRRNLPWRRVQSIAERLPTLRRQGKQNLIANGRGVPVVPVNRNGHFLPLDQLHRLQRTKDTVFLDGLDLDAHEAVLRCRSYRRKALVVDRNLTLITVVLGDEGRMVRAGDFLKETLKTLFRGGLRA